MADFGISLAVGFAARFLLGFFKKPQKGTTNRLDSLKAPSSEYGKAIPKIYGIGRVTGNLIWAKDIIEVKKRKREGKGGPKYTAYTYYGTFDVLLAEGKCNLRRLWLYGEIAYDTTKTDEKTLERNSKTAQYFTFYDGDRGGGAFQDPTEVGRDGASLTPAYYGLCRIVFNGLPLDKYNNSFPPVSAELVGQDIPSHLADLIERSGIENYTIPNDLDNDSFADSNTTRQKGFIASQDGEQYRAYLEQAQQLYLIAARETKPRDVDITDFTVSSLDLYHIQENINSPAVLSDRVAGARPYGNELEKVFSLSNKDLNELPSRLQVSAPSIHKDHDNESASSARVGFLNSNSESISLTYSLPGDTIKSISESLLALYWARRKKVEANIGSAVVFDLIRLGTYWSLNYRSISSKSLTIEKIDLGNNYIATCNFVEDSEYLASVPSLLPIRPENNPPFYGTIELLALNARVVKATDARASLNIFPHTLFDLAVFDLYASNDNGNNYYLVNTYDAPAVIGEVLQIPSGNASSGLVDRASTIRVRLDGDGELSPIPELDFYDEVNLAIVGTEIIAFKNAALVAPKTYDLSVLIRGLYGTQSYINAHAISERFYLLKGEDAFYIRPDSRFDLIGSNFRFKALEPGGNLSTSPVTTVTFTAEDLKCPPVGSLKIGRNDDDAIVVSWQWCHYRYFNTLLESTNVPVSDLLAEYRFKLEFFSSANALLFSDEVTGINADFYAWNLSGQVLASGGAVRSGFVKITQLDPIVINGYEQIISLY
jgi:hypothetical protein